MYIQDVPVRSNPHQSTLLQDTSFPWLTIYLFQCNLVTSSSLSCERSQEDGDDEEDNSCDEEEMESSSAEDDSEDDE